MSNVPAVRTPAGAPPEALTFGQMYERAKVLAKTQLVPKPLQDNPEAIVVVGVWGAEHGVALMTAIQEVHVIENRPSPSAQLRLALIRRAGHEIRFVESDATRAVLKARRREYRNDLSGWVTVTYTIDDARKAELLDEWVERWMTPPGGDRKKKHTWKVGDDTGPADLTGAPDWVREEIAAGRVHSKDNWRKYPTDMLRARAAAAMARMEFSDVMAALGIHNYTAEEMGVDVGQDLDEPAPTPAAESVTTNEDGQEGEVIEDAVLVEDLAPEPEPDNIHPSNPGSDPVPGETPAADPADGTSSDASSHDPAGRPRDTPPMPETHSSDRPDIAALKNRIRLGLTPKGWAGLLPWLEACKIPPTFQGVTRARIAAVEAELDLRGVARLAADDDVPPPPTMPSRTDG